MCCHPHHLIPFTCYYKSSFHLQVIFILLFITIVIIFVTMLFIWLVNLDFHHALLTSDFCLYVFHPCHFIIFNYWFRSLSFWFWPSFFWSLSSSPHYLYVIFSSCYCTWSFHITCGDSPHHFGFSLIPPTSIL
jgi:hypothetical protein